MENEQQKTSEEERLNHLKRAAYEGDPPEDPVLNEPLNVDRFDEEYAAEVADPQVGFRQETDFREQEGSRMIGFSSIALAIISLFVWPVVLGSAAIITGIVSYVKGNKGLGVAGIVIGIISFIAAMMFYPYA